MNWIKNKALLANLALMVFSFGLVWIGCNVYLYHNMAVDGRDGVTAQFDEWQKTPDIVPDLAPQTYVRGQIHPNFQNILPPGISLPLGGVPNVRILHCEEDEGYHIEKNDRYGFFNPDANWDKDIHYLIVGDSFAQGACTNFHSQYQIQKISGKNTVSIGMGGSGSLIEYASFVEFLKKYTAKKVYWYIVANDITDLDAEQKSPILQQYWADPSFTQNYFSKDLSEYTKKALVQSDIYLRENHNNIANTKAMLANRNAFWEILNGHYLWARITRLQNYVAWKNHTPKFARQPLTNNKNLDLMKQVFAKVHQIASDRKIDLQFVFIQSKAGCYKEHQPNQYLDLIEFFKEKKIPYIAPLLNETTCDRIYATKRGGHFNYLGYEKLAKEMLKQSP